MTKERSVQELLDLVRLLEGQTVRCDGTDISHPPELCKCKGTGQVPDEHYEPLREVVRQAQACGRCGEVGCEKAEPWPKGALAGALYHAVRALHLKCPTVILYDFGGQWQAARNSADPDEAALRLVIAALRAT